MGLGPVYAMKIIRFTESRALNYRMTQAKMCIITTYRFTDKAYHTTKLTRLKGISIF
jgi:hypothetical protein